MARQGLTVTVTGRGACILWAPASPSGWWAIIRGTQTAIRIRPNPRSREWVEVT